MQMHKCVVATLRKATNHSSAELEMEISAMVAAGQSLQKEGRSTRPKPIDSVRPVKTDMKCEADKEMIIQYGDVAVAVVDCS